MRKIIVFVAVVMTVIVNSRTWAAGVTASDVQCSPTGCVDATDLAPSAIETAKIADLNVTEGKIANGAVTDAKISGTISGSKLGAHTHNGADLADETVTNSKIGDGAITDAKISGTISGTKIGSHTHDGADIVDGTVTTQKIGDSAITNAKIVGPISATKIEKPANVVIVAKSGGDYTSIQAAIDSINPTSDNTYLIKVMPGKYIENISMKSYLQLQGAGKNVTTISGGISITGADVVVSDLAISGGGIGINYAANISINGCLITGSGNAIFIGQSAGPIIIKENIIRENYFGIYIWEGVGGARVLENSIENNYIGLYALGGGYIISGNIIMSNGLLGIDVNGTSATIIYNKITNNGGIPDPPFNGDIFIGNCENYLNMSFNVYDTILNYGSCNIWNNYNVKSDGSPKL